MIWKPTTELMENIISTGVDAEILNDLLAEVETYDQSLSPLVSAKKFVSSVVSTHISWSDVLDYDVDEYIQPKTYLKGTWRPKEETIKLLISELKYDRVKVGFIREYFKKANQGNLSRTWDCLFIKYAMVHFENESTYTAEDTELATEVTNPVSDDQRYANKIQTENLVSGILDEKHVSLFFNYSLNKNWQPAKWVVNKLLKRKINKRFIYNEIILPPFKSHFKSNANLTSNIDAEYYRWVITRFRTAHKLITKEIKDLEEKLKEINEKPKD